jgi:translation elongation factor EF-Tu-like GTPase
MMTIGMSSPKRGLPKAPTTTVTMAMRAATITTVVTTVETMAMKTPSDYIRCVVELAVNPSGISTRQSMNVSKPWKR